MNYSVFGIYISIKITSSIDPFKNYNYHFFRNIIRMVREDKAKCILKAVLFFLPSCAVHRARLQKIATDIPIPKANLKAHTQKRILCR